MRINHERIKQIKIPFEAVQPVAKKSETVESVTTDTNTEKKLIIKPPSPEEIARIREEIEDRARERREGHGA